MKNLWIGITGFFLLGCASSKTIAAGGSKTKTLSASGVVHVAPAVGCKAVIETTADGENIQFYPVQMDSAFLKEGLKVTFSYRYSKVKQPRGCSHATPVVITKIRSVK
ncbi:MAG: hypothetical protein U0T84_01935 [Chitinophagales bacterium]